MNTDQAAIILYTAGGLVILWYVLFFCWRDYKTDKFRQRLFDLRAELFDYARAGNVSFTNPSYVQLRLLFNSMIRFAHEVSFVRLASAIVLEKLSPRIITVTGFRERLSKDRTISDEARLKLEKIHNRLMVLVAFQIITTSIVALPAFVLYAIYTITRYGPPVLPKRVPATLGAILSDRRFNRHIELIEQQALETREQQKQQQVCGVPVG
jgi:hypothetical protein